jgi:hypothetical protein
MNPDAYILFMLLAKSAQMEKLKSDMKHKKLNLSVSHQNLSLTLFGSRFIQEKRIPFDLNKWGVEYQIHNTEEQLF